MNRALVAISSLSLLDACVEEASLEDAELRMSALSEARLTLGTSEATEFQIGPRTTRAGHGVRVYCPVSHYSYDDPIIFPNQEGRAHLHMFVGNTSTGASTMGTELLDEGNSSCEGGTAYRSSAWMPALLRGGETVVPRSTFVYYKSFAPDSELVRARPIPNGLEMLASPQTRGYRGQIGYQFAQHQGEPVLRFSLLFPECVATAPDGEPILRFQDMPDLLSTIPNSHVAYPGGPDRNAAGCPPSHPYRFIGPEFIVLYEASEVGDDWALSSDLQHAQEQGESLHADYIAAIDDSVNEDILRCVREARDCEFPQRSQLPERFFGPDNERVYFNSTTLADDFDRTPFGDAFEAVLDPMSDEHDERDVEGSGGPSATVPGSEP